MTASPLSWFQTYWGQFTESDSPRHGLARKAARRWYSPPDPSVALDVFGADWDTLIILDACRFDALAALDMLDGTTRCRYSRATNTLDWLHANAGGKQLHDTVYTTANGHFERYADELNAEMHAVDGVWHDGQEEVAGISVVRPDTVTDRALAAHERYPRKRHLVHYVQPHAPFLGEDRDAFPDVVREREWVTEPNITPELVRRAYRENLEIVLDSVTRLLDNIDGRIVVSADHGELLGERVWPIGFRQYGHPSGLHHPKLVNVPWHVTADGQDGRREIVAEMPIESNTETDGEQVREHLRALGYHE